MPPPWLLDFDDVVATPRHPVVEALDDATEGAGADERVGSVQAVAGDSDVQIRVDAPAISIPVQEDVVDSGPFERARDPSNESHPRISSDA